MTLLVIFFVLIIFALISGAIILVASLFGVHLTFLQALALYVVVSILVSFLKGLIHGDKK